ncbi:MAG: protein mraZ [Bacteroidales bacterium]|nr:protein mraZ [Bacteroidales bacterium]
MITFIGEFPCKLDDKGRVLLPSTFIRQMAGSMQEKFVLKKDLFEKCLVLYPMDEWERQSQLLLKHTNSYKREHNTFLRGFFKGTAEVTLDSNNRLLIPRRLLDEIGANREIVMAGQLGKIEIWTSEDYEKVEGGDEHFAQLAEKIMGNLSGESIKQSNNPGE